MDGRDVRQVAQVPPLGVHRHESRVAEPEVGLLAERVHLAAELAREEDVVRAQPADERALGGADARVERVGGATVRLSDVDDRVAVTRDDPGRRVGRAVVHDDQLDVRVVLLEHALDAAGRYDAWL